MIDAATILSKVDVSIAATSLLFKPFNIASFYLVVNSLVDNLNTHIKDSNSVIAKPLNIF